MAPDRFRKQLGFAGLCAAPLTLITTVPALAQGLVPANLGGIAPFAVAIGAGGFALLCMALVRTLLTDEPWADRLDALGKVTGELAAGVARARTTEGAS